MRSHTDPDPENIWLDGRTVYQRWVDPFYIGTI